MANPTVINVAQQGGQFFSTLLQQQQQAFAGNQAALQAVNKAWEPVLQTGAVPYGYSPELDQLLQSKIVQQGAASTSAAQNAAALRAKQESGGANVLPTGAQEQIAADIAAKGAQSTAQNLAQEKEAGFNQGLENLKGATSAELGIAGNENEVGLASGATGAGGLALNAGEAQWKENQTDQMNPLNLTKSILGDIGAVAGDITGIGNVGAMFSNPASSDGNVAGGSVASPNTW